MSTPDILYLHTKDKRYPERLRQQPAALGLDRLATVGNPDILQRKLLALFCSVKCPGSLVLQAYDLAQALREAGIPVIGGFHTPVEKECLDLLLRGRQPLVICPARGLARMRIPSAWRAPLAEGRLLVISPFGEKQRRVTAVLAAQRNAFVAACAHRALIAYAAPGGKTEALCRNLVSAGKTVLTLDSEENMRLIGMGAQAVQPDGSGFPHSL